MLVKFTVVHNAYVPMILCALRHPLRAHRIGAVGILSAHVAVGGRFLDYPGSILHVLKQGMENRFW